MKIGYLTSSMDRPSRCMTTGVGQRFELDRNPEDAVELLFELLYSLFGFVLHEYNVASSSFARGSPPNVICIVLMHDHCVLGLVIKLNLIKYSFL